MNQLHGKRILPLWNINSCCLGNGTLETNPAKFLNYHSCAVDSVIDLFDYAILNYILPGEINNENVGDLLKMLSENHKRRSELKLALEIRQMQQYQN